MSQDTRSYLLPVVSYHCVKILLYLYEHIQGVWTELLEYTSSKIYLFLLCGRKRIYSFPWLFSLWKAIHFQAKKCSLFSQREVNFWITLKLYIRGIKWKNNFVLGQKTKKTVIILPSMCFFLRESKCNMCTEIPFIAL